MTTGETITVSLLFIGVLLFGLLLALPRLAGSDPARVSIAVRQAGYVECHVPIDRLNRGLDIIIEGSTGEGYDLSDQDRPIYTLDIPKPLYCPHDEITGQPLEAVQAHCDLQWFDLLVGKMKISTAHTQIACEKE